MLSIVPVHFSYHRFKGFTLLELLIAISLSALLLTVLVAGLNQISRDWERRGGVLDKKIDESLLLLQIEKAILGTFAYSFRENATAPRQLFFEGSHNELKWVSTVSPDRSSGLTLWQVKTNEEQGMQVSTLPVYPGDLNKQLQRFEQAQQNISTYFEDYQIGIDYLSENTKEKKEWSTNWLMEDKKTLPLGIRIRFEPVDIESSESGLELFSFISVNANQAGGQIPFGFGGDGSRSITPNADRRGDSPSTSNPLQDLLRQ